MEKHFELADTVFEQQFKQCQLNPEIFSHEAHLRLAWIHINRYGIEQAEENIQRQLKQFVKFIGATDKYHTTLTIVAIRAVNHFIQQSNTNNFKDFIAENTQLNKQFKELISSHYSFDIFQSTNAKNHYIAPDLLAFN